ncbi:type I-E CRISPR-associated protein Cas5/CasD [Marinomonas sp. 15G1-11]|uniref:Type I-E CRISPR-associated protein Cas5/CasD n=1 Tax=Marinomonas phaeophyticola TaxID=3004091 RepID=A0ABT4JT35_9GAMM|nr:type I-E CRISPR-associated protein Cas5/CasD [Marinomonas sp. 15G1-11]MCZ2721468.1 type I-E CRISPR-associated protein Cas5/CasD [Marinomonas sp. 15G1-11]
MKDYLVFRLYGPMASWGQPAVGGDRATAIAPTRSAILGLLGAALGIKRDDAQQLDALHTSVQVATKQVTSTSLLRDFHTAEVPSQSSKNRYKKEIVTRKDELEAITPKDNPVLSKRDYRCDGIWIVAISLTQDSHFGLEQLKQALIKPVYVLSLGRKSCPLAAPLMPVLLASVSLREALDHSFPSIIDSDKPRLDDIWLPPNTLSTYTWEGNVDEFPGETALTTHPWDDPINRDRWQFKQRTMHQIMVQQITQHQAKIEEA